MSALVAPSATDDVVYEAKFVDADDFRGFSSDAIYLRLSTRYVNCDFVCKVLKPVYKIVHVYRSGFRDKRTILLRVGFAAEISATANKHVAGDGCFEKPRKKRIKISLFVRAADKNLENLNLRCTL